MPVGLALFGDIIMHGDWILNQELIRAEQLTSLQQYDLNFVCKKKEVLKKGSLRVTWWESWDEMSFKFCQIGMHLEVVVE